MFYKKTLYNLQEVIESQKDEIHSLNQKIKFYSSCFALGQSQSLELEHIKHGQKFYKYEGGNFVKRIILCEKNKEGKEFYACMVLIYQHKEKNYNFNLTDHGWLSKEELFEKIKDLYYIPVDNFFEDFPVSKV